MPGIHDPRWLLLSAHLQRPPIVAVHRSLLLGLSRVLELAS
jgi:hypothetical protein